MVFGFLFVLSMARGQGTYFLAALAGRHTGRALERSEGRSPGSRRAALARWLAGPSVARGAGALRRWGVAAVPLAYLTVGVQTLIFAAAGVMQMPWRVFTLAQIPGALAWAAIYSTIGWAAWQTAVAAVAGHTAARALLAGALAVAVLVITTRWVRQVTGRRVGAARGR
ncbi:MAG: VTT domain-containing protein [Kineosporiaceae bacterium]|nr:VTT domain-containing protein [Kineosporiaceae bacterium]